jgi:uncharacterized protein CbrC (UPF0167 family)
MHSHSCQADGSCHAHAHEHSHEMDTEDEQQEHDALQRIVNSFKAYQRWACKKFWLITCKHTHTHPRGHLGSADCSTLSSLVSVLYLTWHTTMHVRFIHGSACL